jgi:hypothetical protein
MVLPKLLSSFLIVEYNKWSPLHECIVNKEAIDGSVTKKASPFICN